MNVSCSDPTESHLLQYPTVIWLFCTAYAIVGLLSFFGNSLVIYIVVSKREMRTITNVLIANLAISDLIITITSLWVTPAYVLNQFEWIFGRELCYINQIVSGMSIIISSFTLTAIAVDRYLLIIHPFSNVSLRPRLCYSGLAILVIWFCATTIATPPALYLNLAPEPVCGRNVTMCREIWHDARARTAYGTGVLAVRVVLPFSIITFCYVRITIRLRDMNRRLRGRKRSSFRAEYNECKRKQSMQRILIAMVVLFVLCSAPLDFLNAINDYDVLFEVIKQPEDLVMLRLIAHFIHMTGTLWNPMLYAWGNENFKKELHNMASRDNTVQPGRTTGEATCRDGALSRDENMSEMQHMLTRNSGTSAHSNRQSARSSIHL